MGPAQRRLSNLRIIRIATCSVAREPDSFPHGVVADRGSLGKAKKMRLAEGMKKIVEADFLPRETNGGFSWPGSIGAWGTKEKRRILIVDNARDTTHLVKVLLERTGDY